MEQISAWPRGPPRNKTERRPCHGQRLFGAYSGKQRVRGSQTTNRPPRLLVCVFWINTRTRCMAHSRPFLAQLVHTIKTGRASLCCAPFLYSIKLIYLALLPETLTQLMSLLLVQFLEIISSLYQINLYYSLPLF